MALHRGIREKPGLQSCSVLQNPWLAETAPRFPQPRTAPLRKGAAAGSCRPSLQPPPLRAGFPVNPSEDTSLPGSRWGGAAGVRLTLPLRRLSSQQALAFPQAGAHQAGWWRASESLRSAFAKPLCINIKNSYSLHATLAELGILMSPSRSDIQLRFSGSKANSWAPLKANSLCNQGHYYHVDTEKK